MADKTKAALAGLAPAMRPRAFAFIDFLRSYGVPVVIVEGRRSKARQRELYGSGRVYPGPILTSTLSSKHLTGRAFDIGFPGHSLDAIPVETWATIGQVGEYFGLRWGGRWQLRDYVHFEV